MAWYDKAKSYAETAANVGSFGLYNAGKGAMTQSNKAETYDPNRENFSTFGDEGYTRGQAEQLGYGQQGSETTAAGYRDTGAGLQASAQGYQGRGAPTIDRVSIDPSQSSANTVRSGTRGLYSWGNRENGPSAAQAQLNNATAANMRGNLALSRSGRGAGSAAAGRAALGQNAIVQGEAANNSAILRAQEINAQKARELSALQSGTAAAQGLYQTDTGREVAQGQLDLSRNTAQGRLALDSRAQNDAMTLGVGNQALGYAGAADAATGRALQYDQAQQGWAGLDLSGRTGYEQTAMQGTTGASIANAQFEAQRDSALLGAAGGAASAGLAMSDVRAKEDIQPVSAVEALRTARAAPAYSYQYRDPRDGQGTKVGPMAQDLERTPLGNTLVDEGPDGQKRIDGGRAGLVALSAAGEQQAELDRLMAEVEDLKRNPYATSRWQSHYAGGR